LGVKTEITLKGERGKSFPKYDRGKGVNVEPGGGASKKDTASGGLIDRTWGEITYGRDAIGGREVEQERKAK